MFFMVNDVEFRSTWVFLFVLVVSQNITIDLDVIARLDLPEFFRENVSRISPQFGSPTPNKLG